MKKMKKMKKMNEDSEEDESSEDLSPDGLKDDASQEVYLEVSNQDSETPTCSHVNRRF